jgi:hypothetical protein
MSDPRADLPTPNRRHPDHGHGGHATPPVAPDGGPIYEPPPPHRARVDRGMRSDLGLVVFLVAAAIVGIVVWNVAGNLTHNALHPRATAPVVGAGGTPTPGSSLVALASPAAGASLDPSASASAPPSASPAPTPRPKPVRAPITYRIDTKPAKVFVSELEKTWCAAAAVQIALNITGDHVDTSRTRQLRILNALHDATTRADSRNGGAGPLGMVATLERMGDVNYALRIYDTRADALRGAATAIAKTGHPAILMAWRGAHAWVMNGFKADADPRLFKDAKVSGAFIIDPWYPRVSSIWGPSDGPGVFQDAAEMVRNYLPWRRPEGHYPGRDHKFLVIVPTS